MELVGAALGDQVDLRPGRPSCICVRVRRRYAKFLSRIKRRPQHPCKGEAIRLIVVVQTVQSYVALIGAGTSYRSAAAVVVLIDHTAQIQHARLKTEQVRYISSFDRQGF